MSIQTKIYQQKKTGKEVKRYFANVHNPILHKSEVGPLRAKRAEAVSDENRLIQKVALMKSNADEADKAIKRKGLTVSILFESWKEAVRDKYASGTYRVYINYYQNYIGPVFGDKRVEALTSEILKNYINLLAQKYSAETVNKIINILSVMSKYSLSNYGISLPLDNVERKRVVSTPKVTWTSGQLQAFLKYSKSSHYYPMFLLSIACGCRPGEVCGIASENYFPDLHGISLTRGYNKFGILTEMKTSRSHRWLPLPDVILYEIDKHTSWKEYMRKKHPGFAENDFLFVSEFGAPITPDTYSHAFRRILKRYNNENPDLQLPVIPLYNCRHSFATNTLLGSNPATIREVSAIMGNSPRVMMERYAQIVQEANAAVVNNYFSDIFNPK